jgi:hypothetical protein
MSESEKILETDNLDRDNIKIEKNEQEMNNSQKDDLSNKKKESVDYKEEIKEEEAKKEEDKKEEDKKEEKVNETKEIVKLIIKIHDDQALYDEFLLNYSIKIDKKQFNNVIKIIGHLDNNKNNKNFNNLVDAILLVIKDKRVELIEIPLLVLKINDILGDIDIHKFSKNDVVLFIKFLFFCLIDLSVIEMNKKEVDDLLKLLDLSLNLLIAKIKLNNKIKLLNCFINKKYIY